MPESTLLEAVKWVVCARCGTRRPPEALVVDDAGETTAPRCRNEDAAFCSDPKGERRVPPELMGG